MTGDVPLVGPPPPPTPSSLMAVGHANFPRITVYDINNNWTKLPTSVVSSLLSNGIGVSFN